MLFSSQHPNTCGCTDCLISISLTNSCRDLNVFRPYIDTFAANRRCPLEHPQDSKLCSEYLRRSKESTMMKLLSLIDSQIKDPCDERHIPTSVTPKMPSSSTPNFSRIQENAKSAVNLQNLKQLSG